MHRRILIQCVILSTLTLLGGGKAAEACWPHCGRVWYPGPLTSIACCAPCWSVCDVCAPCDPCCDPCGIDACWAIGVRPGPIRRFFLGPYRWYRVPVAVCDVCGCSPCACEPAVVTSPMTLAPAEPTPAQPAPTPTQPSQVQPAPSPAELPSPTPGASPFSEPAPTPNRGVNPTSYVVPSRDGSGLITVYVPAEAKVFVNGRQTKSNGTRREYVSYGLQDGLQYRYTILAQVERDGKLYEETREVILTAGAKKGVAFSFQFPSEAIAGL